MAGLTICKAVSRSGLLWVGQCPLWVISGHRSASNRCPLYPQKRQRSDAVPVIPIRPPLGRTPASRSGTPASLAPPTRNRAECGVDLLHMAKIDNALV